MAALRLAFLTEDKVRPPPRDRWAASSSLRCRPASPGLVVGVTPTTPPPPQETCRGFREWCVKENPGAARTEAEATRLWREWARDDGVTRCGVATQEEAEETEEVEEEAPAAVDEPAVEEGVAAGLAVFLQKHTTA